MASHPLPPDLGGFNPWDWAGAAFGAAISLIYSKPTTKREFVTRIAVAVGVGGTFAFALAALLGWPDTARNAFAAGAGLAFFSYAVIEAGFRIIRSFEVKKAEKGK